jgi:hypothetical protein
MDRTFRVTEDMHSLNRAKAAEAYVAAGLKLIVTNGIKDGCCTCGKSDCPSPGKHPLGKHFPQGVLNATNDLRVITRALRAGPEANIAACLEGLTVVDTDGPAGKEAVAKLELPPTVGVKTSRGTHRYFGGELPQGSFKLRQADVLTGKSHYVMLPPSMHESGIRYRWLHGNLNQAARVPPSLLNRLRGKPEKASSTSETNSVIARGERNDALFKIARSLRQHLSGEDTVLGIMMAVMKVPAKSLSG